MDCCWPLREVVITPPITPNTTTMHIPLVPTDTNDSIQWRRSASLETVADGLSLCSCDMRISWSVIRSSMSDSRCRCASRFVLEVALVGKLLVMPALARPSLGVPESVAAALASIDVTSGHAAV